MTIFITVLSGVFVFVLGQIILKLFVDPWQKQRECIANISNHILMYSYMYSSPGMMDKEIINQVSNETRGLASELIASCSRMPFYKAMTFTKLVLDLKTVKEVQSNLIGLSNSMYKDERQRNDVRIEKIKDLLKINFF